MFGFNGFSQNAFSAFAVGGAIVFASAQVSASAEVISASSVTKPFSGSIYSDAVVVSQAIRQRTSVADISSSATFDLSNYIRIRGLSADISAYALFDADGFSLAVASGSIFSNVSVTADAFRILAFSGSVNATAEIYALGGYLLRPDAIANSNGVATVTAYPNTTWSASGSVNANGTITALGTILGEEWTDSAVGTESWTNVSTGSETWTEVSSGNENWLRQG